MSPVVFISFVATLLCSHVLSPILMNFIAPKHRFGRKTIYMNSFLGSTVHAVVSCAAAIFTLAQGDLVRDKIFAVNSASVVSLHITMGYVLGDTLICLVDPYLRGAYSTLLHHLAMIAGILMCLHFQLFYFFVIYRLIAEFSTPFVNWRAILYEMGEKESRQYAVAALGMVISFFLCRVLVIPWHNYALFSTLLSAEASTVLLILKIYMVLNFILFDILNTFWFYKMLKGAYRFFVLRKLSTK